MLRYQNEMFDDFKKKRQQYLIILRQKNREQIINRHRIGIQNTIEQEISLENIVDTKHANQIKKLYSQTYHAYRFQEYIKMIDSFEYLTKVKGIIAMKCIVNQLDFSSSYGKSIISMITTQKILKFISFIHLKQQPQLKYESAVMLASITYPQQNIVPQVINSIIIKLLINLLNENEYNIIQIAITLAINMSQSNINSRNLLIELGIFEILKRILHTTQKRSTYLKCIWGITFLVRSKQSTKIILQQVFIIICQELNNKIFNQLQSQQILQIFQSVIWTLLFIVKKINNYQKITQSHTLSILMDCLVNQHQNICFPAIKILGKIISYKYIDNYLQNGILNIIPNILSHPNKKIRLEICWIISHIILGNSQQIYKIMLRKDIFDKIYQMFINDQLIIKQEICWIYPNLKYFNDKHKLIQIYLHYDIIKNYVQLLDNQNVKVVQTALKSEKAVINGNNIMLMKFIQYGGIARLQKLQEHQSDQIYSAVVQILSKFFEVQIQS